MYVFIYRTEKRTSGIYYRGYEIEESADKVGIVYDFEIPGLASFHPTWEFPKKRGEQRCFKENGTFREAGLFPGYGGADQLLEDSLPPCGQGGGGKPDRGAV